MTTHTIITVDLDQPTNRAALGARFRAYIARDTDSDLDWLISGGDGELHLDCIRNGDEDAQATTLRFWVNTKYSLESSEKLAQSMSGAYPTANVQWSEAGTTRTGARSRRASRPANWSSSAPRRSYRRAWTTS
jgi:hypothetical protein